MCRMEIRFFASHVRRNGLGIVSYAPGLGKIWGEIGWTREWANHDWKGAQNALIMGPNENAFE